MSAPSNRRRARAPGPLLAATLLLSGWSVAASASGAFDGPSPFIVPASAFNLDGFPGSDYLFDFAGMYLQQAGSGASCFQAPVYLPSGVAVLSMSVSAYDTSASDFTVSLSRSPSDAVGRQIMASASTSGTSGFQIPVDTDISFPDINNQLYLYRLETCLDGGSGPNLRLYAVRIDTSLFSDGFETGNTSPWSVTVL